MKDIECTRMVSFSNLPEPYQLAIAWWMSVDGVSWNFKNLNDLLECGYENDIFLEKFRQLLPEFNDLYGNIDFNIADFDTSNVIDSVMVMEEISSSFSTWQEYHQWYISGGHIPQYSENERWPVIIAKSSEKHDEFLLDGWHRFHSYARSKHKTIPVVLF